MGKPECRCPSCAEIVLATDTQCMNCGASLLDLQRERRQQDRQLAETQAAQQRFEARLAKLGPRSASCIVCQKAPAQATCNLCSRLICRGCIAAWEPDFLCPSCHAVTTLETAPATDLVKVGRELQRLDPALARHSPRGLTAKVGGILARGKSVCDSLGAAGALEAQQAVSKALSPAATQWRQASPAAAVGSFYSGPSIPLISPTSEQSNITQSVLTSLRAAPYYGSAVDQYVLETAESAGIPAPKVWLSPEEVPNACAVGFTAADAHVVVTKGLLERCGPGELKGIVGHEVAHVARADSVRSTALAAKALGIVLTGDAVAGLVELGFLSDGDPGNDWIGFAIAGAVRAAATAATVANLSRDLQRAEFAADALGGNLAGGHVQLASALARLEKAQSTRGWAGMRVTETSHMFFAPTGFPCAVGGVQSHPSTAMRCQALCLMDSGFSAEAAGAKE